MRRLFFAVSIVAGLMFVPAAAHAWNGVGHLAVAKIAYDRLDDSVKTRLFGFLKRHPHYDLYLAANRPAEVSEVEWAIVRTSVWPDWVRPRGKKDPRGFDVIKYHRGEEHYINIPFIDPKDEAAFQGKTLVDPDLPNVVTALKQHANNLKTRTAAHQDRAIAACWMFHLVGDVHQPLHNVTYFSDTKAFRAGDQGGNKFGVRADGRKIKLHAFWDNILGDDPNYLDDTMEHDVKVFGEAVKLAEGLRGLKLSDADQERLAKNTTYESWSQEGFELAKTVGYLKGDRSGLLEGVLVQLNGTMPDSAPELGAEYLKAARATAEARIVIAGQRLAERITKLIGP